MFCVLSLRFVAAPYYLHPQISRTASWPSQPLCVSYHSVFLYIHTLAPLLLLLFLFSSFLCFSLLSPNELRWIIYASVVCLIDFLRLGYFCCNLNCSFICSFFCLFLFLFVFWFVCFFCLEHWRYVLGHVIVRGTILSFFLRSWFAFFSFFFFFSFYTRSNRVSYFHMFIYSSLLRFRSPRLLSVFPSLRCLFFHLRFSFSFFQFTFESTVIISYRFTKSISSKSIKRKIEIN